MSDNKKNILWYLGFLSLVSLLYFVKGQAVFLLFLGFLPYFALYKLSDERIELNLGKAARNAFLYNITFGVGTIVYIYFSNSIHLFAPAFVLLFGGSLLVCIISLFYYEKVAK